MSKQVNVRAKPSPPHIVLSKKLNVDAAGINGFNADPAPNLILVSITDPDGRPVSGLVKEDFTLVNYAQTDGHARLVQLRLISELRAELPEADIDGVYKIEPEQEPEITRQVGQTGDLRFLFRFNLVDPVDICFRKFCSQFGNQTQLYQSSMPVRLGIIHQGKIFLHQTADRSAIRVGDADQNQVGGWIRVEPIDTCSIHVE